MRGYLVFLGFYFLSLSGFAAGETMLNEVCNEIVPFAHANQIEVSDRDLYHCHTVTQLKDGEEKVYTNDHTWSYLEERRWGYVCHAHEKDGKRTNDNFNIFYKDGEISFWGAGGAIVEEDVLPKFSLPAEKYATTWTNIYFFPKASPFCSILSEMTVRTCGGVEICIGLENDEYSSKSMKIEEELYPTPKFEWPGY